MTLIGCKSVTKLIRCLSLRISLGKDERDEEQIKGKRYLLPSTFGTWEEIMTTRRTQSLAILKSGAETCSTFVRHLHFARPPGPISSLQLIKQPNSLEFPL